MVVLSMTTKKSDSSGYQTTTMKLAYCETQAVLNTWMARAGHVSETWISHAKKEKVEKGVPTYWPATYKHHS
jgi:hypothetical protein